MFESEIGQFQVNIIWSEISEYCYNYCRLNSIYWIFGVSSTLQSNNHLCLHEFDIWSNYWLVKVIVHEILFLLDLISF